mgnify:FL=1|tara:strand:+ start:19544 stop:20170 length:627 start_codon:yes stop_codon:yes gene_type:complete
MPLDQNSFQIGNNKRTINSFKDRLQFGGARPNLFEVKMVFPNVDIFDGREEEYRMMVKGAQLPASNIAEVVVPFRGRQLKVAGDRRFDPWTLTVLNDADFKLREAFERWANYIIKVSDGSGTINPSDYFAEWEVYQLGRANTDLNVTGEKNTANLPILRGYKMWGCWPSVVSGMELSYDTQDTIEEFQITMQVQYWEAFDKDNSDSVV